jgi:(5-formylfuran-3-yl)methyl phosphate synthase
LTDRIAGVLVDTWDKTRPIELDERWVSRAARVRQAGKLVALAGGLDCRSIATLGRLAPDIVAVRGAACVDGDRRSAIDLGRVADLARLVGQLDRDQDPTSNLTP